MTRVTGDTLAGGYRLTERLRAPAGAWLADGPDGVPVVLVPRPDAGILPDGVFHPALAAARPLDDEFAVRPWIEGRAAAAAGTLPVRDVYTLGSRLAEALAVLHGADLAHGAIEADTVILRDGNRAVLVDPILTGTADADVAALAAVLAALLGEDASADDRALFAAAAADGWPALEFRDRLDDARLAGHAQPVAGARARVTEDPPTAVLEDPGRIRRRWTGIAIATSIAVMLVAWWLLPSATEEPVAAPQETVEAEEPVAPPPAPPTEDEIATMLEQRRAAQAVLDEFINLQLVQEERAVERWGKAEFDAAVELARQAETPFREQAYVPAERLYAEALAAMKEVAALGDRTLAQALADGAEALERGASQAATEHFELALAIEADHEIATAGLARAATLDQAIELRTAAETAEEQGRFEDSLARYRELIALDPAMPGAAAAPARLAAAIEDRDFRQAMSDGLAALEIEDWATAKRRFEIARGMRPRDPAPGEFIAEAERRSREYVLGSHRRKAAEAMTAEDWESAIAHYEAILKREPNARVATDGLELARERAELYGTLDQFTTRPEGWWSDAGRERARELLGQVRDVPGDLPALRRLGTQLARQLALAEQPVTVTLRSDNACNVVVYKVARLGTFDERTLDLKPGRYTAVATRSGFRDVRKEFLVPAGREPAPVNLICEEPV